MVEGTDRLGVLRLGLPGGADGDDPGLRQRCSVIAGLAGHLVATKFAYGDVLNVARRSTPLTVAAELLWQLLAPLTVVSRDLVITAVLAPHDRVGGDGVDYAVDEKVAFCGLFDAAGHDLPAPMACRRRRPCAGWPTTFSSTKEVCSKMKPPSSWSTGDRSTPASSRFL
jgi:hypothetical protein